ncbi:two-component flavin-dependent monooxygenase [Krasilnikovia cinnamomea]|uniref:Two-component flavin-dependent monooxygenase n=1 Tax=Krasilnikovia cinnamomea TaxID=349313 RepID=A0A4Q7ZLX3_9ACTN|nr:acyl-CoA dehydrogenase family protein [Krasilnikovia cinnamomea]RZU51614.1 two-component flavin-dependent monooxygenase [Krasilnikovia cinnamomea]
MVAESTVGLGASAEKAALIAGQYAEAADAARVLPAEVAEALAAAGFARHFVPGRWGGSDGAVADLLEAAATVGRACPSAAWCAAVAAGAARMGVFLPRDGQAELWAQGPDSVVVGALVPSGECRPVPGGWVLSGTWPSTSAVDHSDWALVAVPVRTDAQARIFFFAVPRKDYGVTDSWFTVGMRGTGSNTLTMHEVFVPAHRVFDREAMLRGQAVDSTAPCHRVPLRAVSGVLFAAPALGAARGAFAAWSASMTDRLVAPGAAPALRSQAQQVAARSAGEIDAAELLLRRVARACDRGGLSPAEAVRMPYDCALAVDLLVGAVERVFRAAGSRGQSTAGPLQRLWRDIHCLSTHVALQAETAGAAYGDHLLGVAVPPGTVQERER